MMTQGTLVDATIIKAPNFTKNKNGLPRKVVIDGSKSNYAARLML